MSRDKVASLKDQIVENLRAGQDIYELVEKLKAQIIPPERQAGRGMQAYDGNTYVTDEQRKNAVAAIGQLFDLLEKFEEYFFKLQEGKAVVEKSIDTPEKLKMLIDNYTMLFKLAEKLNGYFKELEKREKTIKTTQTQSVPFNLLEVLDLNAITQQIREDRIGHKFIGQLISKLFVARYGKFITTHEPYFEKLEDCNQASKKLAVEEGAEILEIVTYQPTRNTDAAKDHHRKIKAALLTDSLKEHRRPWLQFFAARDNMFFEQPKEIHQAPPNQALDQLYKIFVDASSKKIFLKNIALSQAEWLRSLRHQAVRSRKEFLQAQQEKHSTELVDVEVPEPTQSLLQRVWSGVSAGTSVLSRTFSWRSGVGQPSQPLLQRPASMPVGGKVASQGGSGAVQHASTAHGAGTSQSWHDWAGSVISGSIWGGGQPAPQSPLPSTVPAANGAATAPAIGSATVPAKSYTPLKVKRKDPTGLEKLFYDILNADYHQSANSGKKITGSLNLKKRFQTIDAFFEQLKDNALSDLDGTNLPYILYPVMANGSIVDIKLPEFLEIQLAKKDGHHDDPDLPAVANYFLGRYKLAKAGILKAPEAASTLILPPVPTKSHRSPPPGKKKVRGANTGNVLQSRDPRIDLLVQAQSHFEKVEEGAAKEYILLINNMKRSVDKKQLQAQEAAQVRAAQEALKRFNKQFPPSRSHKRTASLGTGTAAIVSNDDVTHRRTLSSPAVLPTAPVISVIAAAPQVVESPARKPPLTRTATAPATQRKLPADVVRTLLGGTAKPPLPRAATAPATPRKLPADVVITLLGSNHSKKEAETVGYCINNILQKRPDDNSERLFPVEHELLLYLSELTSLIQKGKFELAEEFFDAFEEQKEPVVRKEMLKVAWQLQNHFNNDRNINDNNRQMAHYIAGRCLFLLGSNIGYLEEEYKNNALKSANLLIQERWERKESKTRKRSRLTSTRSEREIASYGFDLKKYGTEGEQQKSNDLLQVVFLSQAKENLKIASGRMHDRGIKRYNTENTPPKSTSNIPVRASTDIGINKSKMPQNIEIRNKAEQFLEETGNALRKIFRPIKIARDEAKVKELFANAHQARADAKKLLSGEQEETSSWVSQYYKSHYPNAPEPSAEAVAACFNKERPNSKKPHTRRGDTRTRRCGTDVYMDGIAI